MQKHGGLASSARAHATARSRLYTGIASGDEAPSRVDLNKRYLSVGEGVERPGEVRQTPGLYLFGQVREPSTDGAESRNTGTNLVGYQAGAGNGLI